MYALIRHESDGTRILATVGSRAALETAITDAGGADALFVIVGEILPATLFVAAPGAGVAPPASATDAPAPTEPDAAPIWKIGPDADGPWSGRFAQAPAGEMATEDDPIDLDGYTVGELGSDWEQEGSDPPWYIRHPNGRIEQVSYYGEHMSHVGDAIALVEEPAPSALPAVEAPPQPPIPTRKRGDTSLDATVLAVIVGAGPEGIGAADIAQTIGAGMDTGAVRRAVARLGVKVRATGKTKGTRYIAAGE
jgi:hypothetical protein